MIEREVYDLIVVGGGEGGKTLAMYLAKQGYTVALIERDPEMIGGTCINVACIPTKTLVQSAKVAHMVRRAGEYGVSASLGPLGMRALRERKRAVVGFMREANYKMFTSIPNLEFILGEARFTGDRMVEITLRDGQPRTLAGKHVVINTGARPAAPTIPGLAELEPLTNETIMELDVVPEHLLIIGGGFEGVEFAQMFRRFGSRVTIIQRGAQLLSREDPDVSQAVRQTFEREGIEVRLGAAVERAESAPSGARLHLSSGKFVDGSHILHVTGRTPATAGLNVEANRLALDARGYIPVTETLATAALGVWAVGDVKGGPEFTHTSLDDYRIVKAQITGKGDHTSTAGRILAYAVFTDPELGRVGLSEREARAQGWARPCRPPGREHDWHAASADLR